MNFIQAHSDQTAQKKGCRVSSAFSFTGHAPLSAILVRFLAGAMLVFQSGLGSAQECDDLPLVRTEKDDGSRVGLFISNEQFAATPVWHPRDGEPPVSLSDAYSLVTEWARTAYPKYDRAEVREIALQSQFCVHENRRWYYHFEFTLIFDGKYVAGTGNWAAVLMDGSVIGATEY